MTMIEFLGLLPCAACGQETGVRGVHGLPLDGLCADDYEQSNGKFISQPFKTAITELVMAECRSLFAAYERDKTVPVAEWALVRWMKAHRRAALEAK